jgi:chromosome partitioning protein
MRINTTLVINPKGGSGKTTVAINLASYFAADNIPVTLMDYDPQGSSLNWLRSRAPHAPRIHAANGAPGRYGQLRSFDMFVPPHTQQLVIDAPAGSSGVLVQEMLERAHSIVVPVVPSVIDIHATSNFIREIMGVGRVRSGDLRVAVVANKVRLSMPAYQPFLRFLDSLDLKLLARLLDSEGRRKRRVHLRPRPQPHGGRAKAVHADHRVGHGSAHRAVRRAPGDGPPHPADPPRQFLRT